MPLSLTVGWRKLWKVASHWPPPSGHKKWNPTVIHVVWGSTMKTIPSGSSNRFCPVLTNTTCTLFFDKTIIVIQVPYISTLYHTVRRLLIVLYILYFYHVHSPNDFCIISPFTTTLGMPLLACCVVNGLFPWPTMLNSNLDMLIKYSNPHERVSNSHGISVRTLLGQCLGALSHSHTHGHTVTTCSLHTV